MISSTRASHVTVEEPAEDALAPEQAVVAVALASREGPRCCSSSASASAITSMAIVGSAASSSISANCAPSSSISHRGGSERAPCAHATYQMAHRDAVHGQQVVHDEAGDAAALVGGREARALQQGREHCLVLGTCGRVQLLSQHQGLVELGTLQLIHKRHGHSAAWTAVRER